MEFPHLDLSLSLSLCTIYADLFKRKCLLNILHVVTVQAI